jgi:hypothetical protein
MRQNLEVTINQVEHISLWTAIPFAEVVRRIEAATGVFDLARIQTEAAAGASPDGITLVINAMAGASGFMRFAKLDHGHLLTLLEHKSEAVRYVIGHPLIAARMTRRNSGAGLYAPLSLLVRGVERGGTRLEYDRPSTLVRQFDDAEITAVGLELDDSVAALVQSVAGGPTPTAMPSSHRA